MAATLVDYRRLLRLKGYDGATDVQLDDAINEARRRIVRDRRWSFLDTTAATLVTTPLSALVSTATLTDLQHIDAVRPKVGTEERVTAYLPLPTLRSQQVRLPAIGLPENWSRRNATILLYPTPDIAYTLVVDYVAKPVQLTAGTDPLIPDELQDLVAWAAIQTLAQRQRDWYGMQFSENSYQSQLRMASAQENVQQRQGTQQVTSGYWGPR